MDDVAATRHDVATSAAATRESSTNQQPAAKELTPRDVTVIPSCCDAKNQATAAVLQPLNLFKCRYIRLHLLSSALQTNSS